MAKKKREKDANRNTHSNENLHSAHPMSPAHASLEEDPSAGKYPQGRSSHKKNTPDFR